ncbi:unnamed protein product [Spirodela intermedia]|uniref:Uncharacterized protein n=1 Tax=Spirodela intermedia TaxID=51605 RepID=A0A7I8IE60_SPIIN|nr:unnamed protein product [Spirodela intermedia]CAA6656080.1 unnamed protein product [Spirodela intermedia]
MFCDMLDHICLVTWCVKQCRINLS